MPADQTPEPLAPAPRYEWLRELPSGVVADGAEDAERVYLPLEQELIALRRSDGQTVWSYEIETRWPPHVTGSALFVTSDSTVHVLDPATGRERLTFGLPAPPAGPLHATDRGLVVSVGSGDLVAFDPAGTLLWTSPLGAVSSVRAASAGGDAVYVALADGRLVAVSGVDGRERWTRRVGGTLAAPTAAGTRVYVGSSTRAAYAFDGGTGRLLWDFPTGAVVGTAVDDESLYVVSLDNVVRALHVSRGSLRWKRVAPTRPLYPPVRSGSRLFVGSVRPQLLGFDARTGEPTTTFTFPEELELAMLAGAPLVMPDVPDSRVGVVLVTRDGRAFGLAFDAPAVPAPAEPGDSDTAPAQSPALSPDGEKP